MNTPIKAAAIQMKADLGDIESNLAKAEKLIEEAASAGSSLIIVPEFFTSAMAFHPSLLEAALPLEGKAHDLLTTMAKKTPCICWRFIPGITAGRCVQHLCPRHAGRQGSIS